MIYSLPTEAPPEAISIAATMDDQFSQRRIATYAKPGVARYTYKQRFFSPDCGRTVIELYDYPRLEVDKSNSTFAVEGWNISLPLDQIADLSRQICRKFVTLWGKAQRRCLSVGEHDEWLGVLDKVDYTEFSIERSEARVYEGLLLRKRPILHVEWSDGERVKLPQRFAGELEIVDPGELFTARVRLGRNEQIQSLENVIIIGREENVMEGVFADWPPPRSR